MSTAIDTTRVPKERPILFSAPMVRAILAGRKTQTRRVMKPGPISDEHGLLGHRDLGGYFAPRVFGACAAKLMPCRYGAPGDRLWVREAHRLGTNIGGKPRALYEADGGELGSGVGRLRPSIHMPRWASRITLEVTSVRVERLQSVSEADAKAEGAAPFLETPDGNDCWTDGTHRTAYEYLWNEINGWHPNAWNANPWVWVVDFKLV